MPCMRYGACDGEGSAGGGDIHPGLRGMDERRRMRAIARLDPHEHVGDGGLQAHELDALAAEAARHGNDPAFDDRVGQFAQPAARRGCSHHREAAERPASAWPAEHRRAPHDVVAIRQRLGQLEVRRARFVGARARVMRKDGRAPRARSEPRQAIEESRVRRSRRRFRAWRSGCSRNPRHFREMDLVMRLHRLERTLPRSGALLIDPCRLDLRFDLVVGGHAPGRRGGHEHEMPTQARLDRSLPGPGSDLIDRSSERASE